MMRFDAIVSIHVRHDVICFKLGKCLDVAESDRVIPWTALASSQSKSINNVRNFEASVAMATRSAWPLHMHS